MFETFRTRMEFKGANIREANKRASIQIMENSFDDSQTYRKVRVDGKEMDARIISDSKTTVRGGNGNHVIEFRDGFNPRAGTYVEIPDIEDSYHTWLIMYESDSTLFPKHIIKKCNYLLKWKNSHGEIIERWCVFNDNSKLMDAERQTNYNKIRLSSYNISLVLPCDKETINIRIDKRFLIDHIGTEDVPDAWIVTNRNIISKTFDDYDGVIELAVSKHQYNHDLDNRELMIANYNNPTDVIKDIDEESSYDCRIVYKGTSDLKMGTPYKDYVMEFYNNGVLSESVEGTWDIILPEENDNFTYIIDKNTLRIKCKFDGMLIGTHIRLIASNDELGCSAELPVKVVSSI